MTSSVIDQSFRLMQDGTATAVNNLAQSGPLGLAVVVLASAVVWLMLENRRIQNARLDDAKQTTKDMLALSDKVTQALDRLDEHLNR